MDGEAWWATVHGVAELDMTERFHFHFHFHKQETKIFTFFPLTPEFLVQAVHMEVY